MRPRSAPARLSPSLAQASLLEHGALKEDLPQSQLLTKTNLDVPALLKLSRRIATVIGLPETTQFCDFHPAKLFDFSTRARCLAGFHVHRATSRSPPIRTAHGMGDSGRVRAPPLSRDGRAGALGGRRRCA